MMNKKEVVVLKPIIDKIPDNLKQIHQWVNWKKGDIKPDGRYTKIPVGKEGYNINAHDQKNWLNFEDAYNTYLSKDLSGIAIDLSSAISVNENLVLIGGDLDKCVLNYDGVNKPILNENADKIINLINTYYEVSPSGTGLRFFFLSKSPIKNKSKNGYEIYSDKRFLTITGHGWGELNELDFHTVIELNTLMFDSTFIPELSENIFKFSNTKNDCRKKLISALSCIPANLPRDKWRNLLFSIKAHNIINKENIAREWSKTAGEYNVTSNPNGYDVKQFDDIWKYEPNSIDHELVYRYAKNYGWNGIQEELFDDDKRNVNDLDIFGDIYNGKIFKKLNDGKMKYCYPRSKWLKYDGLVWSWCDKGEELVAAKKTAEYLVQEAAEYFRKNPLKAKKIIQHAQNSHNISRLDAMLKVAAAEDNMGVGNMDSLDADPMLVGCLNGIIDLNTGSLVNPNPNLLITRQINANFDNSAKAPLWEKFLNETFKGDKELINYIKKSLGYSLTGLVTEEVFHFCFGIGRNGKSVFANVITKLMGSYAITAPADMLMRRDKNGATNDIARLCGSRLVLANETRSDQRFDDLTIKQLVSTERISARFLHNEFFEFWPTFKIWIRGNHKPVVTDDSEGAWRRIRLVPFINNLTEEEVDLNLEEKLLMESDGILNWMIEGALLWKKEGLNQPNAVKVASNEYRKDCDILGEFISENCKLDSDLKVLQKSLWSEWIIWAEQNGYRRGSKKTFTRKLKDRGILDNVYINTQRAYAGISLIRSTGLHD